jgi:hypothetical protein
VRKTEFARAAILLFPPLNLGRAARATKDSVCARCRGCALPAEARRASGCGDGRLLRSGSAACVRGWTRRTPESGGGKRATSNWRAALPPPPAPGQSGARARERAPHPQAPSGSCACARRQQPRRARRRRPRVAAAEAAAPHPPPAQADLLRPLRRCARSPACAKHSCVSARVRRGRRVRRWVRVRAYDASARNPERRDARRAQQARRGRASGVARRGARVARYALSDPHLAGLRRAARRREILQICANSFEASPSCGADHKLLRSSALRPTAGRAARTRVARRLQWLLSPLAAPPLPPSRAPRQRAARRGSAGGL